MNMRILLTIITLLCLIAFKSAWSEKLNSDYQLGAGDVVKISVYEHPDLVLETRVSVNGKITFPMVGEVWLGGKTTAEAEQLISQRLIDGEFLRKPQVTVVVIQFQSQQVNVLGMVNKPGKYSLERVSHVLDLLALANGVAIPTAANYATLIRTDGTNINVDLNALFQGNISQNYIVNNGDVIVIPKAPMFYVYGEVQRPGSYRLEKDMTVIQAISMGGGLTPKGTDFWPNPVIKRRDAEGKEQEIDVDEGFTLLQEDDVLYLKESWF
jgi:polysaccharide export outer membrane protein